MSLGLLFKSIGSFRWQVQKKGAYGRLHTAYDGMALGVLYQVYKAFCKASLVTPLL